MTGKAPQAAARTSTLRFDAAQLVDAVTAAAAGDGRVPDELAERLARERGDKKLVVVAAAPKAGSTFLVNTLMRLTGLRGFRLCAAYATNENDLYLPALCLMNAHGCVSQLHMKGTFHNAALMRSFGITPIILTRRIEDIVVSLQHDLKEKARRGAGSGVDGYSFLWLDPPAADLGDDALTDRVIDLALPWFVNFYVSWYRLCEQGAVTASWVTYEELFERKSETLEKLLGFLGLEPVRAIEEEILSQRYATFRDGRIGQGSAALSEAQRGRIRALFSYYPGVDFGKYGLRND